ncbi:hypothetical protein [Achromobacter marplatensis]|uniref:Uncharacterized protein n=1 Tax=Achromobacter marplatensis TaxID=470868 RepID=A0AA42WE31_9BURK|nr:hypothetical protein [Achromobacter marplatensis]MDH2052718.1 hypothetical protein [Achromobacter marplatensis]
MRRLPIFSASICLTVCSQALAWEATDNSRLVSTVQSSIQIDKQGRSGVQGVPGHILNSSPVVLIPYVDENAVAIGEGVDLVTGRRLIRKCVKMYGTTRVHYNNKDTRFSEVSDEESLWRKLNLSISAKASYVGYSGGGSHTSEVEVKTSSKKITTVAQATLRTYAEVMVSPLASSSEQVDLVLSSYKTLQRDPGAFREECGDGFVAQITYGADLYGILQFSDNSYERKEKTKTAIDASGPGGVFTVNGSAEMEQVFKSEQTSKRVQAIERGANPQSLPSSRDDLVKSFESLGQRALGHERPVFVTVVRYSTLPRGREGRYIEVSSGLDAMIRRALRLKTILMEVKDAHIKLGRFIHGADDDFAKYDYVFTPQIDTKDGARTEAGLKGLADALQTEIKKISEQIALCIGAPTAGNCYLTHYVDANDFSFRARAPLPINALSEVDHKEIYIASKGIDIVQNRAKCKLSSLIIDNNIYEVDRVRCENDNECALASDLAKVVEEVYGSFGLKSADCS